MLKWYLLTALVLATQAHALQPVPELYQQVAAEKGIPPYALYSLARVESNKRLDDGRYMPWPWTLNDNALGQSRYYRSQAEAADYLTRRLKDAAKPNIDIGLGQVNCYWHCHRVAHPLRLLNPLTNLRVAADILAECYRQVRGQGGRRWVQAAGCYHSPYNEAHAKRYRDHFLRNLRWASR